MNDTLLRTLPAIVDCCAKCVHYFVSNVTHVGYPHVVVNVRYAPYETFLAVEFEERTRLCACYQCRIDNGIGFVLVCSEHLVGCVVQAFVCFFAMGARAVRKVGVELIVFFFGHNVCVLMVCSTRLQR